MKYTRVIFIGILFYISFVSVKRIINFALGDTRWHLALFDSSDFPLIDWWVWLIPSLALSWLLYRFAPTWLVRTVVGLVAVVTLFFIVASYM